MTGIALAAIGGIAAWSGQEVGAAHQAPPEARGRVNELTRYGRDVRPILSDRCFKCHGPDAATRKADLRLDDPESATAQRKHGAAIVPGDPKSSLMWTRICSEAPDDVMPPPESGKQQLTAHERQLIFNWIAQGAHYEQHWSFVPPVQPTLPQLTQDASWCRTDIDRFILQSLQARGLKPSEEADRATLARRVFLDLTGLPPTPEETKAFVDDTASDAYERLVDMLLTKEPYVTRYAERMAAPWLDLARYADTSGIHMDAGRQAWSWRDWVLQALHSNMPYDQFVVEQLAGDLMPNATAAQQVATGFNRNHVTSDEGGALDAEYLLEYAVDRTNTTGAVFLGLSVGCARCHDHKFDPVSTQDFYSLLAFFNSNEEPGIYSQTQDIQRAHEPFIEVPSEEQKVKVSALDAELAHRVEARSKPSPEDAAAQAAFMQELRDHGASSWAVATPVGATSANSAVLLAQPDGSVRVTGPVAPKDVHIITVRAQGSDQRLLLLEFMADAALPNGRTGRAFNGNAALSGVSVEAVSVVDPSKRAPVDLTWAWADIEQNNGDFRAVNVLDLDAQRSWAPDSHNAPEGRTVLLCAREPFGFEGGTDLVVRLRYESEFAQHEFGRVRVRTARADDALLARLPEATSAWYITGPFPSDNGEQAYTRTHGPEQVKAIDMAAKFENQMWRYAPAVLEDQAVGLAQGTGAEFVAREIWSPDTRDLKLALGSDDGIVVYLNGAQVHEHRVDRPVAPNQEAVTLHLQPGRNTLVCKVVNTGGPGGFFHRAERGADCMARDGVALALPAESVTAPSMMRANDAYRAANSPRFLELTKEITALQKSRAEIAANIPKTMVMRDRAKPTETFVMSRGLYDKPDKSRPVQRAVPVALGTLPVDAPATRLTLAKWIVSPQNPLTARVTVNRLWELFFGKGIVRTSDDFGLQGEWPSHPELLDWLAVDLREHGWDMRRAVRNIVLSSTYRQASRVRADSLAVDGENRLLSYFPRQRLTAEQIRDQALFVSGLLVEHMGGPSVKPYQPDGLWQEVAMPQSNTRIYMQGKGEELWRRSLYTYWKRAAPPPSMLALDAPTREFCTTKRLTTNTPLQALVLWNDPQFVEASRNVAVRTLHEPGSDDERLHALYARCTGVHPPAELTPVLRESLAANRARYEAAPKDAQELLRVGQAPVPSDLAAPELAAWTLVANSILASDATIVKD